MSRIAPDSEPQAELQSIGEYRVIRKIATTDFSEVYEVEDAAGKRFCAKILSRTESDSRSEIAQNFVNEARTLSQIHHENIVRVEKIGLDSGRHFICLEFVQGEPLTGLISPQNPLRLDRYFDIVIQIARGIAYFHKKGIVHKDLKPDNIMVQLSGNESSDPSMSVKVVDFGLSGDREEASNKFVGTAGYISPEQGGMVDWPINEKSDLYAAGVIFYELLTGRHPFEGKTGAALLFSHLSEIPTPPQRLREEAPPLVGRIILKLMAKKQEDRYESADGLLADLEEAHRRFEVGDPSDFELDRRNIGTSTLSESFVGREKELEILKQQFSHVRGRQFKLALVGGRPGVGKSVLLKEFENQSLVMGARFVHGKCYEFARHMPGFALREALEDFLLKLDRFSGSNSDEIRHRLHAHLRPYAAELVRLAPAYSAIFPDADAGADQYKGEENDRRKLSNLILEFFTAVSHPAAPLVLLLDDLQWADSILIELLIFLTSSTRKLPVMVVGTYRSEEVDSSPGLRKLIEISASGSDSVVMDLQPFDVKDSEALVRKTLGVPGSDLRVTAQFVGLVFERTGGNPFFIMEILKAFHANQILSHGGDGWVIHQERAEAFSLPQDVADLIVKRLLKLSQGTRAVLGCAALIGMGFSFEDLSFVCEADPETIFSSLREAVADKFLSEKVKGLYRFHHDRIHEACKLTLGEAERSQIHRSILDRLESSGRQESNIIFRMAEHALALGDPARIVKACTVAGDVANSKSAIQQSLRYYQTAVDQVANGRQIPDLEFRSLRFKLAKTLGLTGKYPEAMVLLEALLKTSSDSLEEARLLGEIGECLQRSSQYEQSKSRLELALSKLGLSLWHSRFWIPIAWDRLCRWVRPWPTLNSKKVSSKKLILIEILKRLFMVHIITDIRPLLHISYRMLRVASGIGISEQLALANQYLALALANQRKPDWKKAVEAAERSVEFGRMAKADQVVAGSMVRLAAFSTWRGSYRDGLVYSERAREMLSSLGNLWDLGNAHIFGFFCRRSLGELPEALAHATTLVELGEKTGSVGTRCSGMVKVAEICHLNGEARKAMETVEKAVQLASREKLWFDLFQAYKVLGQIQIRTGDFGPSRKAFAAALEILKERGGGFFRAYLSEAELGWIECAIRDRAYVAAEEKTQPHFLKSMQIRLKQIAGTERFFRESGHVLRVMAILETVRGRHELAMNLFKKAILEFQRQERPIEEAVTKLDAGTCLSENYRDESLGFLHHARATSTRLGLPLLKVACEDALKSLDQNLEEEPSQLKRRNDDLLGVLLEVSAASLKSIDPMDQARAILDKLVSLMNADRALLFIYESEKSTHSFRVGRDRSARDISCPEGYSTTIVKRVFEGREAIVVAGTEEGALIGSQSAVVNNLLSMIAVPIQLGDQMIGAIYLDHGMAKGIFAEGDIAILQAITKHIAVALQAAKLYQLSIVSKEMEKDLEITKTVQSLFMPKSSVFESKAFEFGGYLVSASQSGGDWWWHEATADDGDIVMMADVSGHGPGPAMITSAVASCVSTFKRSQHGITEANVPELVQSIHEMLCDFCQGEYWMTLGVLLLRPDGESFKFWSAGAPPILVLDPDNAHQVIFGGGAPLGSNEVNLNSSEGRLPQMARLFLASDGVYEMKVSEERTLGRLRVLKILKDISIGPPEATRDLIRVKLEEARGQNPLEDDVSFLTIQRRTPAVESKKVA